MHSLNVIPTDRDRHNAAVREALASRQQAEYDRVLLWAMGKFGVGWLPAGRHYLLDKQVEDEARRTGERPEVAATVYSVRHMHTGRKRQFTVTDGLVVEHESYEEGFGAMLQEPHPTMRIEVKGQKVAPFRYSLCWAPLEIYQPRSAEELAKLRVSREEKKAVRAEKKYQEETPLFAEIDRQEGRGR